MLSQSHPFLRAESSLIFAMNEADLFADALEVTDPAQRAALLDAACGGDLALRQRVEHLLSLHEGDREFLEPSPAGIENEPTLQFVRELADTSPSKFVTTEPVTEPISRETPFNFSFPGYDVEREIGRGGMGVVLKAHDQKLAREVAIKMLAPQLAAQAEAVQRFLREARSAAMVRHENVVTIYSVDDNTQLPFLVMEFIDGESLQQRLMRDGPLSPREAAEIARQTALGLAAAHAKGLVHRDVKPGNVLLEGLLVGDLVGDDAASRRSRNGRVAMESQPTDELPVRVKLTDFGLARAVDDCTLTQSGFIAGTPQYMSPEQADSAPVDHRADLFSLGSVLFAMLTGQPPFSSSSTVALLRQIVDAEPQPIGDRNAPEAASLWLIVDKLLAKQPEQRFQTATEVAQELGRFLANEPLSIAAEPRATGAGSTDVGQLRRRKGDVEVAQAKPRGKSVVLLGAALLIGAVGVFVLTQDRGQQPEVEPTAREVAVATPSTPTTDKTGNPSSDAVLTTATPDAAATPATVPEIAPAVVVPKPHLLLDDDYVWDAAINLGPGINTPGSEDHACISADGLTLIFVRFQQGSGDLWWSVRSQLTDPFPAASPLPEPINSPQFDTDPFLSADGLSLWFASQRPQGVGASDIYVARRRSSSEPFEAPTLVAAPINTTDFDSSPFMAADELTFLFARGTSPRRIYQATRSNKDEPFSELKPLKSINTGFWHEFPRLMPDGLTLLVVASTAPNVQHLWGSFRPTPHTKFGELINLGPIINDNEGLLSGPSWCEATATLYFSSQRRGTVGRRDLWSAKRVKKGTQRPLPPLSSDQDSPPLAVAPFNSDEARQHQEAWATHLKTKVEIENSIGMSLRLIPPGEFLMGAPDDDPDAQPQEKPQHQVRLTQPFFMGATEVTIGQFRKFVESEQYKTLAESDQLGAFDLTAQKNRRDFLVWNKLSEVMSDDGPVRCVGWEDAMKFCEWLSKSEGQSYRLPTDAEWEYACRAGTTTRYSFGNEFDISKANSNVVEAGRTRSVLPVRTFTANPFGLFDMHGNVNEICWDAGLPFTLDALIDPVGSLEPSMPPVVRGGAASSSPGRLRSSQRYVTDARNFPGAVFATQVKGFRVVRAAPQSRAK